MTLTTTGKAAVFAQETDSIFVELLTVITPDSPASVTRLANYNENVVYNGNTYTRFPMSLRLPTDENGQITEAQIVLDNVDRDLLDEIRNFSSSLTFQFDVVDITQSPITLERTYPGFSLTNVSWDQFTIQGRLVMEQLTVEPFPKGTLNPGNNPGLF